MHSSLSQAQLNLQKLGVDAWLAYDYAGSNPTIKALLGKQGEQGGRLFLIIPQSGQARLLVHTLDKLHFADLDLPVDTYVSWQDIRQWLTTHVAPHQKVAMEYSPLGELPPISLVDAGTIELVRSLGPEIVSSADLFQLTCCAWTPEQLASHRQAAQQLEEVKDLAFDHIRKAIQASTPINEYEVQQLIMNELEKRGLDSDGAQAIVATGANSRFPHYTPSPEVHSPILANQPVLIDIWAKPQGEHGTYADITWMGYTGSEASESVQAVFQIVKTARDKVTEGLAQAWSKGETLQGWQLDRLARDYIVEKGYGDRFVHTTGHSLGYEVHAPGVGLNDLSSHDTRSVIPGIGLTVEPGIYLEDFGIRLELDVYIDPLSGPVITTPPQTELVLLG